MDDYSNLDILHDMTTLNLIPVVLAVSLCGSQLANRRIRFYIDNEALVTVLDIQSSKSSRVMKLIRLFVLDCF